MPTATKEQKVQKIRNAEYYDFQGVQDTLYTQSKADKVFRKLMPIILSGENIMLAYRNIKKNTGSHTPGVDGKTIRGLSKWQENNLITYIRARLPCLCVSRQGAFEIRACRYSCRNNPCL